MIRLLGQQHVRVLQGVSQVVLLVVRERQILQNVRYVRLLDQLSAVLFERLLHPQHRMVEVLFCEAVFAQLKAISRRQGQFVHILIEFARTGRCFTVVEQVEVAVGQVRGLEFVSVL